MTLELTASTNGDRISCQGFRATNYNLNLTTFPSKRGKNTTIQAKFLQTRVILYVIDGPMPPVLTDHTTCPGLELIYLLNLHKTPSWPTTHKEGMAWYSSRPMPSLCYVPSIGVQITDNTPAPPAYVRSFTFKGTVS